LGKYDELFNKAKLSELCRAAQEQPPPPNVRLLSSVTLQPEVFLQPEDPPMARIAHIEGAVIFRVEIDPGGNTAGIEFEGGHALLRGAVREIISHWKFPQNAATKQIQATMISV
jgi:outer membrane biosynthesis protein TonB